MVSLKYLVADDMGTTGLGYGTLLSFSALIGMPLIFGGIGSILGLLYDVLGQAFKRG